MSSATSRRTAGPNRRRTSSRSRACSRSSSRSSSTSTSALRVTRKTWCSSTSMPGNSISRCEAMRSSSGRYSVSRAAVRDDHEARDVVGHLDPGEAAGAVLRVGDQDGEVQREAGDVGERVRRVDRQRGQHGEHLRAEVRRQPGLLLVVERLPAPDVDALVVELRGDVVAEAGGVAGGEFAGARGQRVQHLARGQPVGGLDLQAHVGPALQAGDADHVELVEVAGEDGQELHPLQQRLAGVLGQREHPLVEGQPGQFAVAEPVVGQIVDVVRDDVQVAVGHRVAWVDRRLDDVGGVLDAAGDGGVWRRS